MLLNFGTEYLDSLIIDRSDEEPHRRRYIGVIFIYLLKHYHIKVLYKVFFINVITARDASSCLARLYDEILLKKHDDLKTVFFLGYFPGLIAVICLYRFLPYPAVRPTVKMLFF